MYGLTKRQKEILLFLKEYIHRHGYSPSYREIMLFFQFKSYSSVHAHIQALKKKGAITHLDHGKRTLSLQPERIDEVELPLIGFLTGGRPLELFPKMQSVYVPNHLVPHPEASYVLRVKGDTLIEELIQGGDLVIVEGRQEFEEGETALVLLNGHEIYLKKIFTEDLHLRLESHHPQYQPIRLKKETVVIQGAVIGLIRVF